MRRLLVCLFVACFISGCTSTYTQNEFRRLKPTKIAVVVGYEVVGQTSLHPAAVTTAMWLSAFTLAGPFVPLMVSEVISDEKGEVSMVQELNSNAYGRLEAALIAKGYEPILVKTVPIDFRIWKHDKTANAYYEHTIEQYGLDEEALKALDVDAVAYLEYRVVANVKDVEELMTVDAVDLRADSVTQSLKVFSLPPDNKLLYRQYLPLTAEFSRIDFERTLEVLSRDYWPTKSP